MMYIQYKNKLSLTPIKHTNYSTLLYSANSFRSSSSLEASTIWYSCFIMDTRLGHMVIHTVELKQTRIVTDNI